MTNIYQNISYLINGNGKQKKAYDTLKKLGIFDILNKYKPILVGTIPINIAIENSDLDIICEVYDFDEFEEILKANFKEMKGFKINRDERKGTENIVADFIYNEFIIEIFGQPLLTIKQNGYRHMIIEERLLRLGGEGFTKEIIKLKKEGLKTEPAFAKLLKLERNPYKELLKLEYFSDEKLLERIND